MRVNQDDHLTEAIKEVFGHYEESYEAGAWENFTGRFPQPEKRPFWLPLLKIAALLVMVMHLLPLSINHGRLPVDRPRLSVKKYAPENKPVDGVSAPAVLESSTVTPVRTIDENYQLAAVTKLQTPLQELDLAGEQPAVRVDDERISRLPVPSETVIAHSALKEPAKTGMDKLFASVENPENAVRKQGSRWSVGIELASGVGSSKMNFSTGIHTQYLVSNKVAFSSGISYAEHNSVNRPETTGTLVAPLAGKELVSNNASLTVLDIPLNVIIKAKKNFYASAGLSFLAVLDERRNNDYLADIPTQSTAVDPGTGKEVTSFRTVRMKVSETAPEQSLEGNSYLGFGNLSVGSLQKIFGDQKIQIEPYVKLPIGRFSAQDLKLTTGGIKFIWKL